MNYIEYGYTLHCHHSPIITERKNGKKNQPLIQEQHFFKLIHTQISRLLYCNPKKENRKNSIHFEILHRKNIIKEPNLNLTRATENIGLLACDSM